MKKVYLDPDIVVGLLICCFCCFCCFFLVSQSQANQREIQPSEDGLFILELKEVLRIVPEGGFFPTPFIPSFDIDAEGNIHLFNNQSLNYECYNPQGKLGLTINLSETVGNNHISDISVAADGSVFLLKPVNKQVLTISFSSNKNEYEVEILDLSAHLATPERINVNSDLLAVFDSSAGQVCCFSISKDNSGELVSIKRGYFMTTEFLQNNSPEFENGLLAMVTEQNFQTSEVFLVNSGHKDEQQHLLRINSLKIEAFSSWKKKIQKFDLPEQLAEQQPRVVSREPIGVTEDGQLAVIDTLMWENINGPRHYILLYFRVVSKRGIKMHALVEQPPLVYGDYTRYYRLSPTGELYFIGSDSEHSSLMIFRADDVAKAVDISF